ncbi:hypothetical protein SELMODRAFT_420043 [Selaginella moellendorffii]|uniref:Uncharacterized protein n=1 Tax=Selaginella moellendorffii TaxID=88036 RepID=D8SAD1_SELML|nr:hypothetical protein SELMODRAFT_420043 [Selaginella moellendorffii]
MSGSSGFSSAAVGVIFVLVNLVLIYQLRIRIELRQLQQIGTSRASTISPPNSQPRQLVLAVGSPQINPLLELGLCIDMVAVNNIIRCYRSVIQDALDLQIGKLCGTIGIVVAGKHGSFVEFFDSLITKILPDQIGQIYLEEKDRDS